MRRIPRPIVLLGLALVACVDGQSPVGPEGMVSLSLRVVFPEEAPAPQPVAGPQSVAGPQRADGTFRQARVTVTPVDPPSLPPDLPKTEVFDIDNNAEEWELPITVPSTAKRVSVSIELLDGSSPPEVAWSGRTEVPINTVGGTPPAEVQVFQGPLDNLSVTALTVAGPTTAKLGETLQLSAVVQTTGSGVNPIVYWENATPSVLQLSSTLGFNVSARVLNPGVGRIRAYTARVVHEYTVTVESGLDLAKTVNATASVAEGAEVVWTLSVSGEALWPGAIVRDVLPSGLEFLGATGHGTYNRSSGEWLPVGAAAPPPPSNSTSSVSLPVTLNGTRSIALRTRVSSGQGGNTITNTASFVSPPAGYRETNADNNQAQITVRKRTVDLAKTLNGASAVAPGAEVAWTLTVSGEALWPGAEVRDVLPAGLSFSGPPPTDVGYDAGSRTVTWRPLGQSINIGNAPVPLNGTRSVTFRTRVDQGREGQTLTNRAGFGNMPSSFEESDDGNNAASVTVERRTVDLAKTVNVNGPVSANDLVEWTLTVSGDALWPGAVVQDPLPAGLTLSSLPGGVEYNITRRTLLWRPLGQSTTNSTAPVPLNGTRSVTFRTRVDQGREGQTLTNTASFENMPSSFGESDAGNNAASVTVRRNTVDLAKTVNANGPVSVGAEVEWTLTLTGSTLWPDPVVTDPLPAGLTFSRTAPAGVTYDLLTRTVTWRPLGQSSANTTSSIPLNGTRSVSFWTRVDQGRQGQTLTNTASFGNLPSSHEESNTGNNAASISVRSNTVDLAKTRKTTSPVGVGDEVVWTLTFSGQGDGWSDPVVVDELPEGLSYLRASGPITLDNGSRRLTWRPGGFVGANSTTSTVSRTIDITTRVDANRGGETLTNKASISNLPSSFEETNTGNNTASVDVRKGVVDLVKTVRPSGPVDVGAEVVWTLSLTGQGLTDPQVRDELPSGLTFLRAEGDGSYLNGVWRPLGLNSSPSIPLNGTRSIAIHTRVADGQEGQTIVNRASIESLPSSFEEANTENNAASIGVREYTPDLAIKKAVDQPNPAGGAPVVWTLTVTNNGKAVASAPIVTDQLPDGVSFLSASGSGYTFDNITNRLTWRPGSMSVGVNGSRTLSITTRVSSDPQFAGQVITNLASVVEGLEPTAARGDNTATASITVQSGQADLVLTSAVEPTMVVAGGTAYWQLTIENRGPNAALDPVVSNALPAEVIYVAHTGDGFFDSGSGTWRPMGANASSSLPVNATRTLLLMTTVKADQGGNTITSPATVSAATADPDLSNNHLSPATLEVEPPPVPDLALTKTASNLTPAGGDPVAWTLTVTNNGTATANAPEVVDVLQPGLVYVSATGDGVHSFDNLTNEVIWQPGSMPVGLNGTRTLTINTTVSTDPFYGGSPIVNTAQVLDVAEPPATLGDNTHQATIDVQVPQVPDLALTKTASDLTPLPGDPVAWTLSVTNNGTATANAPEVVDVLQPGLEFVSLSGPGTYGFDNQTNTVTWQPGSMPVGLNGTRTLTINTTVSTDPFYGGSSIVNTAQALDVAESPATLGDNTDQATIDVQVPQVPDLALTKTASDLTPLPGDPVAWTLTVTNNGTATANAPEVVDVLPPGLVYVSATGDGVHSFDNLTNEVIWQPGSMPVGLNGTRTLTINTTVSTDPFYGGSPIVNTAQVLDVAEPPATLGDNMHQAAIDVQVPQVPDLALTKTASMLTPAGGDPVAWTLTVTNNGTATASAPEVLDVLPPGLVYVSATGDGVHSFDNLTNEVIWQPGSMPVGLNGTRTLTINTTVSTDPFYGGSSIVNTAQVLDVAEPGATLGDNTHQATIDVQVPQVPDLALTKTASNLTPAGGDPVAWTLTVTNNGTATASAPEVVDELPPGLVYVSKSGDGTHSFDNLTNAVTWYPGSMPVGVNGTRTLVINTTVSTDPFYGGQAILNVAGVNEASELPTTVEDNVDGETITVQGASLDRVYVPAPNVALVVGNATPPTSPYFYDATPLINATPSFQVTSTGSQSTANGGSVDVTADGGFVYHPATGQTGGDSFTYTVTGGAEGTVNLQFAGSSVTWFFDPDVAASTGDGSSDNPARHPSEVSPQAADVLFLFSGVNGYASMNVSSQMSLIGEGAGLVHPILGPLVPPGASPVIQASGAMGIDAANTVGVTIAGLDVVGSASTDVGIDLSGSEGAVVEGVTVADVNGPGIDVTGSTSPAIRSSELTGNVDGILSTGGVSGVELTLNILDGNGAGGMGSGIRLVNPTGQVGLFDNLIQGSGLENVHLNVSSTVTVTATGNTATSAGTSNGFGIMVLSGGNVTANLQGNTFASNPFHGLEIFAEGTGTANVTLGGVTPNDLSSNGGGLFVKQDGNGQVALNVLNNTLNNNTYFGVSVGDGGVPPTPGANGSVTGTISGNTITGVGFGDGITILGGESLVYRLDVVNNVISETAFGSGLTLLNNGTGEASLLMQGNAISLPVDNGVPGAVFVGNNVCLDVRDNVLTGSAFPTPFFQLEQMADWFNIAGLGASTSDSGALTAFLLGKNPSVPGFDVVLGGSGVTAVPAGTCGNP